MKFSVVIPSRIDTSDRVPKLIRAINSVQEQTFQDFEIIVVADNCKTTVEIVKDNFHNFKNVKGFYIETLPHVPFSGYPRNTGIMQATGDYVNYLDNDDLFCKWHLKHLDEQITLANEEYDWYFFNDLRLEKSEKDGYSFKERRCDAFTFTKCGTSNICHKRSMKSRWAIKNKYGYDDWRFITSLRHESNKMKVIPCGGYLVCHIPKVVKSGYNV